MRFTISKLAALASLASLTGLTDADLATECMDAGGFTEVTLSSPNDAIESVLIGTTCPPENVMFNAPSSINYIISPTEVGSSAKIFTKPANLVTPSLVGGILQFIWKTDLPATTSAGAGIIVMLPRDQLRSVTVSGSSDVIAIEDGFTSLSSILVSGDSTSNIIKVVTTSTTQLLNYTDTSFSTSATIEAIDIILVITGTFNNVAVKGTVSNVLLSGVSGTVLVEGTVTNAVASGVSNALSVNGNGCDGFSESGVLNTCNSSTTTVMVASTQPFTSTQPCTSSTQNDVCTSEFSSSQSSCRCVTPSAPTDSAPTGSAPTGSAPTDSAPTGSPTSAAARMNRGLVAMIGGVAGLMAFLLFRRLRVYILPESAHDE
jgi:hypothetical protein